MLRSVIANSKEWRRKSLDSVSGRLIGHATSNIEYIYRPRHLFSPFSCNSPIIWLKKKHPTDSQKSGTTRSIVVGSYSHPLDLDDLPTSSPNQLQTPIPIHTPKLAHFALVTNTNVHPRFSGSLPIPTTGNFGSFRTYTRLSAGTYSFSLRRTRLPRQRLLDLVSMMW